jgi:hypothetical protein
MRGDFFFLFHREKDGLPSPYSGEQIAINSAFVSFHEAGGWKWDKFTVTKVPCDLREESFEVVIHAIDDDV